MAVLPHLIFDFDSTLVTVEAADELFARALGSAPDRAARLERFRALTDQGMAGKITYSESLEARLALLQANRADVEALGLELVSRITPSVARNRDRLWRNAARVWVISGGFEELILPVVRELGLRTDRVRAHRFRWTAEDQIDGVDPDTALARGGKVLAVRELALEGPVWIVGDGATDLELRERGLAHRFFAFAENCRRPSVMERADDVLESLDELPTLD